MNKLNKIVYRQPNWILLAGFIISWILTGMIVCGIAKVARSIAEETKPMVYFITDGVSTRDCWSDGKSVEEICQDGKKSKEWKKVGK